MPPKFSFIIPSYNEAEYIEGCIASILSQSQPKSDYEIIVVDSSSPDGTAKKAKRLADKVILTGREGPGAARNIGADAAEGDVLVFADADVRFGKDFLEKLGSKMSGKISGGICPLSLYDAGGMHAASYASVNAIARTLISLRQPITMGSCFIFSKGAFHAAGGFDPSMLTCEDHDLAKRAAKLAPFVWFDGIMVQTSARRVKRMGFIKSLSMYLKATLLFSFRRKGIRNYWEV